MVRSLLVVSAIAGGCKEPPVDLDGKGCPCVAPYRCDAVTQTCTLADAGIAIDAPPCTPTFVKSSTLGFNSGMATFAKGNNQGDVVLIATLLRGTTGSIASVTDTDGNTYQRATAGVILQDANYYADYEVWWAQILGGAAIDNVVTSTPAANIVFGVEYSCLAATNPFDSIVGMSLVSAPYTLTCAGDRELVVTLNAFQGGGVNWSVGGTDRSGLVNHTFEYNDFVGVKGSNSITVSTSQTPASVSLAFRPAR